MPKPIPAMVTPSLLRWARESAGYTIDEIAKRLGKETTEVTAWESGNTDHRPYMGQLRDLANLYKRSLSDFYLPSPPEERPLPHDFRRAGTASETAIKYSPQLRRQLRYGIERQEIAIALAEELAHPLPAFETHVNLNTDPERVGRLIRSLANISVSVQEDTGDGRPAYNLWRLRLEQLGILIFQFEQVSTDEIWGFSISERPFPVVAINIDLSPNARTFTMLHELVHILLAKNGVCDIDDQTSRGATELRVEAFCNHAAAAALMPKDDFLRHPIVVSRPGVSEDWTDDEIIEISKSFGSSRESSVRRLLTLERTTKDFYKRKRAQYLAQFLAQRKREAEKVKKEFARDYAQRAVHNLGTPFVNLVLHSYLEKHFTLADAAKHLDVLPHKVRDVQKLISRAR